MSKKKRTSIIHKFIINHEKNNIRLTYECHFVSVNFIFPLLFFNKYFRSGSLQVVFIKYVRKVSVCIYYNI